MVVTDNLLTQEAAPLLKILETEETSDWKMSLSATEWVTRFVATTETAAIGDEVQVKLFANPPNFLCMEYMGIPADKYLTFVQNLRAVPQKISVENERAAFGEACNQVAQAITDFLKNAKIVWQRSNDLKFEHKLASGKVAVQTAKQMRRSFLLPFFTTLKYVFTNIDTAHVALGGYPDLPRPYKPSLAEHIYVCGNRQQKDHQTIKDCLEKIRKGSMSVIDGQKITGSIGTCLTSWWNALTTDCSKRENFGKPNHLDANTMSSYNHLLVIEVLSLVSMSVHGRVDSESTVKIVVMNELKKKLEEKVKALGSNIEFLELDTILQFLENLTILKKPREVFGINTFSTEAFIEEICNADVLDGLAVEGFDESMAQMGPSLVGKASKFTIPEFNKNSGMHLHSFINNVFAKSMLEGNVLSKADWLRCLFYAIPISNRPQYHHLVISKLPDSAIITNDEYARIIKAVVHAIDADVSFSRQDFRHLYGNPQKRLQKVDESIKDYFLRIQSWFQKAYPETYSLKSEMTGFCQSFVDSLRNNKIKNKIIDQNFALYYDEGDIKKLLTLAINLERSAKILLRDKKVSFSANPDVEIQESDSDSNNESDSESDSEPSSEEGEDTDEYISSDSNDEDRNASDNDDCDYTSENQTDGDEDHTSDSDCDDPDEGQPRCNEQHEADLEKERYDAFIDDISDMSLRKKLISCREKEFRRIDRKYGTQRSMQNHWSSDHDSEPEN